MKKIEISNQQKCLELESTIQNYNSKINELEVDYNFHFNPFLISYSRN
jgi:hypothetical protein